MQYYSWAVFFLSHFNSLSLSLFFLFPAPLIVNSSYLTIVVTIYNLTFPFQHYFFSGHFFIQRNVFRTLSIFCSATAYDPHIDFWGAQRHTIASFDSRRNYILRGLDITNYRRNGRAVKGDN